jgi:hypothetical protein
MDCADRRVIHVDFTPPKHIKCECRACNEILTYSRKWYLRQKEPVACRYCLKFGYYSPVVPIEGGSD